MAVPEPLPHRNSGAALELGDLVQCGRLRLLWPICFPGRWMEGHVRKRCPEEDFAVALGWLPVAVHMSSSLAERAGPCGRPVLRRRTVPSPQPCTSPTAGTLEKQLRAAFL